jgi:hypothetical protein
MLMTSLVELDIPVIVLLAIRKRISYHRETWTPISRRPKNLVIKLYLRKEIYKAYLKLNCNSLVFRTV